MNLYFEIFGCFIIYKSNKIIKKISKLCVPKMKFQVISFSFSLVQKKNIVFVPLGLSLGSTYLIL